MFVQYDNSGYFIQLQCMIGIKSISMTTQKHECETDIKMPLDFMVSQDRLMNISNTELPY